MITHEGTERYPETLGDIQELLLEWKETGISRESVEYVINKVWWE
jgi:hypothetical protein